MPYDECRAREIIRPLIISISDFINGLKQSGAIQQSDELVRKWSVTNFTYDESGISSFAQRGEVIQKRTWFNADLTLSFKVTTLPEYGPVLLFLSMLQLQRTQAPVYLPRFCNKVVKKFLNADHVIDGDIDDFVSIFIADTSGQPLRITIKAGLTGIILEPDEIQIDQKTRLIKPKREDFEYEESLFFLHRHEYSNPSAFLEISTEINEQKEIENAIERSIIILRLYHSGMIRTTGYKISSSSIFYDNVAVGSLDTSEVHEKYLIKNSDTQKFIQFWEKITTKIPDSLYRNDISEFKSISYNRYTDALKLDNLLERRIATAIMGLEGIFLGGENAELQFRLSVRIAQLLKNITYDPLIVKQVIKDAYEVRSIFLHGNALSAEKKRKLAEKYGGGLNNLLLLCLDYLRVSLIISIALSVSKESFVKKIDDSLWNLDLNEQLLQQINEGKIIVALSKMEN